MRARVDGVWSGWVEVGDCKDGDRQVVEVMFPNGDAVYIEPEYARRLARALERAADVCEGKPTLQLGAKPGEGS